MGPSQHYSAPQQEEKRREDGEQSEQEREEGHRGLASSRGSGLEPLTASSCFHTHPTSCLGRVLGWIPTPLFPDQMPDLIRSLDPLRSTSLPGLNTDHSLSLMEPIPPLDLPLFSSLLGAASRSVAGRCPEHPPRAG